MPEYTIDGIDNLLKRMIDRMRYISQIGSQLKDTNTEEFNKIDEEMQRYFKDCANIFQSRMELYNKIQENSRR